MKKILQTILYFTFMPFFELGKSIARLKEATDTKLYDPEALKLSRKELDEIVEQEKERCSQ